MAYEYGCIVGMGEYEPCDTVDTFNEAVLQCELLQRDWDNTGIGDWWFNGSEWIGESNHPDEPWYIREIRE